VFYKVKSSIPRFVESDNYAASFGLQWNRFAKTQLDSYTNTNISERRLSLSFGIDLNKLSGKTVLEAGCGAGRFTEILLKYGAEVYSFDYSNAVDANFQNNGNNPYLHLCQADIRHIPFPDNVFDYVICIGVLQHTPDTFESLASLYKHVKIGGELIVDHYAPQLGIYTSLYLVYWNIIKRLSVSTQIKVTDRLTAIWFPIHWKFRNNKVIQILLRRISPINFYYPQFPLTKELHYEWSRLDTHDRNTDHFKRHISSNQISRFLARLGGIQITNSQRRKGVVSCIKSY
jgi:ubiquinone/menaquinone biosynthesis C-methylase UbiE